MIWVVAIYHLAKFELYRPPDLRTWHIFPSY